MGPLDSLVLALVAALAATAFLALRYARAYHRERRTTAFLEKLNEISQVLLTERNLRGVLRLVAESAGNLLSADAAYIAVQTPDGARLVVEAGTGALAPLVGSVVPPEGTVAAEAARTGHRVLVTESGANRYRCLNEGVKLRSAAAQPLLVKGLCVGALGVDNPRHGPVFDAGDLELLRDLANHTGLFLESLRAIDELAVRERRSALVNALNSRIRQSLELQTILDSAVRELGTALHASRCLVRLRRGTDFQASAREWHAPEVASVASRGDPTLPLQMKAMQLRRTIDVPDVRSDPLVSGGSSAPSGPLATLITPILLRGEAIGVVVFHQVGMARAWRPDEVGLVEEVAAELAVGIANARLYRSAEDAGRELAVKIGELERADRMKAQFLANMSHELRTPLNAVIGFSEMLLLGAHGAIEPAQRDALETVARNGRHLLGLVNDILDLSKVEAGRMELHLTQTDICSLIGDVLAGMDSLVSAKEHAVTLELGEGQLTIRADELRVRQILFNLISNAVKFTPAGGQITVRAVRKPMRLAGPGEQQAEREAVWIAVSDNGIGIDAHNVPRLFTEFSQVDSSHARRYEGTGLGLALCKRFVEMHGGQIGVESTLGRGSTFWLVLPVDGPHLLASTKA